MPLSHCQYVAVQKYRWCNHCQNPFAKLTRMYGSQDASLDIWIVLHTIQRISGTPECQQPTNRLPIRTRGWPIPSWTSSAHSTWYHESPSRDDSQHGPYQWCARWWLQSQHQIDGLDIPHACQRSCVPPHKPLLLQLSSIEQVLWRIIFWDCLPEFRLLAIDVAHDVGIIYWEACIELVSPDGFLVAISLLASAHQHLTSW